METFPVIGYIPFQFVAFATLPGTVDNMYMQHFISPRVYADLAKASL